MNFINLILTDDELNALCRAIYETNRSNAPWINHSVFEDLLIKIDEVSDDV